MTADNTESVLPDSSFKLDLNFEKAESFLGLSRYVLLMLLERGPNAKNISKMLPLPNETRNLWFLMVNTNLTHAAK